MNRPDESQRDITVALHAWLRDDVDAVKKIVRGTPDPRAALLRALGLALFFLRQRVDAHAVLDVMLDGDPLREAQKDVSETTRARVFLLKHLADGYPLSMTWLRATASADGIRTKALTNAAEQLGVVRGRKGDRAAVWSLPPLKFNSKPACR
jgi:hypothetical protein